VISGDYSTPDFRSRFTAQARDAAQRSDLIITVSAFTARQVEQLLQVEPSRIRVVHHGVRPVPRLSTTLPREPIILNVGAIQRRKNIVRLVEAFEHTPAEWKLVLAGSLGFDSEAARDRIDRSPRKPDIQMLGYVSDSELEKLYQRASVFAFPSLDEGFGMPILDAMARGVPVLTSNVSAMPEVAGGAALLIDPTDVHSIADGLCQLIADPGLRQTLIRAGLAQATKFTWEESVEATWNIYRELLG
jgi:glycosyltransferase involved in cell wall biosynthesis